MNHFGRLFQINIFGESHGEEVGERAPIAISMHNRIPRGMEVPEPDCDQSQLALLRPVELIIGIGSLAKLFGLRACAQEEVPVLEGAVQE